MGELIDMGGQRFGRLIALQKTMKAGDTRAYWRCRCDCGNETVASGKYLRSGITRSCGCLRYERAREMGSNRGFIAKRAEKAVRHGHKRRNATSHEYMTWLQMKRRCYDKRSKDYSNWGGRGIRVCDEWNNSFESFLADMGQRPSPLHQIDRENPNQDYGPSNCRWVTPDIQGAENRRTLIPVIVDGIHFPSIAAACRYFSVSASAAYERIRSGVPVEVAVKQPRWGMKPRRTRESYLPIGHADRRR